MIVCEWAWKTLTHSQHQLFWKVPVDQYNRSLLFYALNNNSITGNGSDTIELLIKNGIDVDAACKNIDTALEVGKYFPIDKCLSLSLDRTIISWAKNGKLDIRDADEAMKRMGWTIDHQYKNIKREECPICHGSGKVPGNLREFYRCEECGGSGKQAPVYEKSTLSKEKQTMILWNKR